MVPFEVFTWIYVQRRPIDNNMENPRINTLNKKHFNFKSQVCHVWVLSLYTLQKYIIGTIAKNIILVVKKKKKSSMNVCNQY
jgi:hypothetical protein